MNYNFNYNLTVLIIKGGTMYMKKEHLSKSERGKKTREQLLNAGIEVFAKFGPEGITTRHLAKVAGVNIAAIQYYFGGKENYYFAVVRYLVERLGRPILSMLSEVSDQFNCSNRQPEDVEIFLIQLLRNLVKTILLNPEARFFASISSREHLNPTPAYEIIYDAISQIHSTLSKFIGCVLGIPPDSSEAIIRAHALLGQVLLFRIGASTLCRRLQWDTIDNKRAEFIATIVTEMACRSIGIESSKISRKRSQ
jgi:AcrR family transcriptional regulator